MAEGDLSGYGVDAAGVADLAGRVQVVVPDWECSYAVRKAYGKLAGGAGVAFEEDVGEGVAALFGGVELLEERCCSVGDPGFCDWFSRAENDDCGSCGVDYGFKKRSLCSD